MCPREFAVLLLAASRHPPRKRARDQQADRAGLQLRQQVLGRLVALDPNAEELEAALTRIVEELGPPTGPTRAIAAGVYDEWKTTIADPGFVEHLLGEAVHGSETITKGKRRDARACE